MSKKIVTREVVRDLVRRDEIVQHNFLNILDALTQYRNMLITPEPHDALRTGLYTILAGWVETGIVPTTDQLNNAVLDAFADLINRNPKIGGGK